MKSLCRKSKKVFLHALASSIIVIVAVAGVIRADISPLHAQATDPVFNAPAAQLPPNITPEMLREKYVRAGQGGQKVKILIVPGHEPGYGGAEYNKLKERELTVDVAEYLAKFFAKNPRFEIMVARTNDAWEPRLGAYFKNEIESIQAFAKSHKEMMDIMVKEGSIVKYQGAYHAGAPPGVALRLYGINKWANENGVDLMLHIHFNDYPRKHWKDPGAYDGFTIYTPEKHYINAAASLPVAQSVYEKMSHFFSVSDLPTESAGVVEDQELIALGARNTANMASILIEYSYIYEPQMTQVAVRPTALKEYAWQTFVGVEKFFRGSTNTARAATSILPHTWKSIITQKSLKGTASADIFAFQMAMTIDGLYPPTGETKNHCAVSGIFGPCTLSTLTAFQNKYGIKGESGTFGEKTRAKLNKLFGK